MKVSRIGLTVGLTMLATSAFALPPFVGTFNSTYKVPAGSELSKAACATCHVGKTTKMNAYGLDLKAALDAAKTKKLTADVLKGVEAKDSDKDGCTNIAEIKGGSLPGDAKSK